MRRFGVLVVLGLLAYSTVASANLGSDFITALAAGDHGPQVISRLSAGGAMTAATTYFSQSTSTVTSIRVRRVNSTGGVVWTADKSNLGAVHDLELAPTGDAYVLTWTPNNSHIIRISNTGQIMWTKSSGANRLWRDLAVVETGGSGYALIGVGDLVGYYYPTQFAVASFNPANGAVAWEQLPNTGVYRVRPHRVEPVGDDGVYIAGDATLYSSTTRTQLVVAGFDVEGNANFVRVHPTPNPGSIDVKDLATSTDGQFYVGARLGSKQGLYRIVQTGSIAYLKQIDSTLNVTDVEPALGGGALIMLGWVNTQQGNAWSQWRLRRYDNAGALLATASWNRDGLPLHDFVAMRQDPGGRVWVAGRDGQYGLVERIISTGIDVFERVGSGETSFPVEFTGMHFDRYQNLYLSSIWGDSGQFESRAQRASNLKSISPYQTNLVSGQYKNATISLRWAAPNNSFRRVSLAKVHAGDPLILPTGVDASPGALSVQFVLRAGTVSSRKQVPFTASYGGKTVNAVAVIDP